MARRRHTAEEIVNKLRQAEVELAKGSSVAAAYKLLGVTEQTYYPVAEGVRRAQDRPGQEA